jgi:DNA-binding MarR family transcriptional regulator
MARRARRNRNASAVAVAVLKADSRVAQTIERALAEAGLTLPQFNILMELAAVEGGALPLYELNRRLISTPPNTSWLSAKMETAGLVTKTRDSRDSRVVIMAITDQGWRMLEHAAPLVFTAEQRLLAEYSTDELRTLADLLGRLVEQR